MANGEYACVLVDRFSYKNGTQHSFADFLKDLILPFVPWVGLKIVDAFWDDGECFTVYGITWDSKKSRFELQVWNPSGKPYIAENVESEKTRYISAGWRPWCIDDL